MSVDVFGIWEKAITHTLPEVASNNCWIPHFRYLFLTHSNETLYQQEDYGKPVISKLRGSCHWADTELLWWESPWPEEKMWRETLLNYFSPERCNWHNSYLLHNMAILSVTNPAAFFQTKHAKTSAVKRSVNLLRSEITQKQKQTIWGWSHKEISQHNLQ